MTNLCLVVQEEKLKRPLSDMQAWEIAHTRKDPKPGDNKYYGKKTAGNMQAYSEAYLTHMLATSFVPPLRASRPAP